MVLYLLLAASLTLTFPDSAAGRPDFGLGILPELRRIQTRVFTVVQYCFGAGDLFGKMRNTPGIEVVDRDVDMRML